MKRVTDIKNKTFKPDKYTLLAEELNQEGRIETMQPRKRRIEITAAWLKEKEEKSEIYIQET